MAPTGRLRADRPIQTIIVTSATVPAIAQANMGRSVGVMGTGNATTVWETAPCRVITDRVPVPVVAAQANVSIATEPGNALRVAAPARKGDDFLLEFGRTFGELVNGRSLSLSKGRPSMVGEPE